ncbi:hypothetical protein M404DRAFT_1001377 [Pisolithus tinctorius Marx 270]|uniref:Uncharacterized protein n=1 Tax=Pisolithus tinctorius Marx 270 TaxID=870435 RepID=A0A0C3P7P9_PISTI|nr:hypothetical protein M404DRAFT_1001377 [Pisolithus tinctorius Marx 270]
MSGELADQFESPIISLIEGEPYAGIPTIEDSSVPLILIPKEPGVQPPMVGLGSYIAPQYLMSHENTYSLNLGELETPKTEPMKSELAAG